MDPISLMKFVYFMMFSGVVVNFELGSESTSTISFPENPFCVVVERNNSAAAVLSARILLFASSKA